ncbi:hypothetical protein D3C83_222050 [compost metagenome]
MEKAGVPRQYFDALNEALVDADTSNPETCPAIIAFLEAMMEPSEEAARVRAAYLVENFSA